MDGPGHQFLSGAALAQHQHRCIRLGDAFDQLEEALDFRRLPDDPVIARPQVAAFPEVRNLLLLSQHLADVLQHLHRTDHAAAGIPEHLRALQDLDRPVVPVLDRALLGIDIPLLEQTAPVAADALPLDFAARAPQDPAGLPHELPFGIPGQLLRGGIDGYDDSAGIHDDQPVLERVHDRLPVF